MSTSVVPVSPGVSSLDDPAVIAAIKQTVAKGASDAQLMMFLQVCKRTGLDPFLKEVWFVPQTGVIMAARDGYLRIANEHPMFDGMETRVERDERGIPIKAVCTVWRKDRAHPTICEAYYDEYAKDTAVWRVYRSAMIGKVSEVLSLKRSFSINGTVTEEEIGNGEPAKTWADGAAAAKEVGEHKVLAMRNGATYQESSMQVSAPAPTESDLRVHDERVEETKELQRAISALLVEMTEEENNGGAAAKRKALLKEHFGTTGWTATTKLDTDTLRAGLAKLRATLDAGLTKVAWHDKFDMLDDFARIKADLNQLTGATGEAEYYRVLKANGVEKSNQFKDMPTALKAYQALEKVKALMENMKQPEPAYQAVDEDVPF